MASDHGIRSEAIPLGRGRSERDASSLSGEGRPLCAALTLMGVRLYNPATGRFLSTDPIPGGNATAYDYCSADPINCYDLDGQWGWKKWAHRAVNIAVSASSAALVGTCMIAAPCGGAMVVGLAAIYVTGMGAHMAIERGEYRSEDAIRTGVSLGKGAACGVLFARGCASGLIRGGKAGKRGAAVLHGVPRGERLKHTWETLSAVL